MYDMIITANLDFMGKNKILKNDSIICSVRALIGAVENVLVNDLIKWIWVISPEKGKPFERAGRKTKGSKSEKT